MIKRTHSKHIVSKRGTASPAQVGAGDPGAAPKPGTEQPPEWTTERWKHHVEAEARRRLKHGVHNVAGSR